MKGVYSMELTGEYELEQVLLVTLLPCKHLAFPRNSASFLCCTSICALLLPCTPSTVGLIEHAVLILAVECENEMNATDLYGSHQFLGLGPLSSLGDGIVIVHATFSVASFLPQGRGGRMKAHTVDTIHGEQTVSLAMKLGLFGLRKEKKRKGRLFVNNKVSSKANVNYFRLDREHV